MFPHVRKWYQHLVQWRCSVGVGQSVMSTQKEEPSTYKKREREVQQDRERGKRKRIADLKELEKHAQRKCGGKVREMQKVRAAMSSAIPQPESGEEAQKKGATTAW